MWFVDLKSPFFLSFHFETTKLRICFLFDLRILFETLNLSPSGFSLHFDLMSTGYGKQNFWSHSGTLGKHSHRPAVCRMCFCILCAEQNIPAISHLVTKVEVIVLRRVTLAQNIITSKCIIIVFGVFVVRSGFEVWRQYIYSAPAILLQHSHPLWTF